MMAGWLNQSFKSDHEHHAINSVSHIFCSLHMMRVVSFASIFFESLRPNDVTKTGEHGIVKLGQHRIRKWHVASLTRSHYLSLC